MNSPSSQRPLIHIFVRLLWTTLVIPLLASSLVMITIAAFYGGRTFRSQQENLNQSVAYATANYLFNASNVFEILVASADANSLDEFRLSSKVTLQGYRYFDKFLYLDHNGKVLAVTPEGRADRNADQSQQDYFQQAVNSNQLVISPPFISKETGHPAIYLSKATGDGKVIAGELSLNELQRIITQGIGYNQKYEVFITDTEGNLLAHSNPNLMVQQTNLGHLKIVQQARRGDMEITYWDDDELHIGMAAPIETSRWIVASHAAVSEVYRPYYGPAFFYVLFSTVMLALFLRLLGRQFQNTVVVPLSRLSKATSEIASGQYEINPQIRRIPAPFIEIRSLIENFLEMAQSVMAREKLLEHLATHDTLTELPNRALFQKRLLEHIEEAQKTVQEFAVLFIDIDDFKSVNDAFGHHAGDMALIHISSFLTPLIGPDDLVGRVGGDEFAIMLGGQTGVRSAHSTAEALLKQLNQPLHIEGHEVYLSASIGVSIYPQDGSDPDMLIQNADTAMYQTKREGKRGVKFYSNEMETQAQARHTLVSQMHHALEGNEFEVYYQPIYDFHTQAIVGSEALLRWKSSQMGMLMPEKFIPLACETGLILPIGEWVLHTACEQNRALAKRHLPELTVSVNVAERQIKYKDFRETVEKALKNSGLPPHQLLLELSENIFFQNLKTIERLIIDFKQMGVKLSLDDFGTGYSTLSCLTRIPFDEIKIDRSLSRNLTTNSRDAAIVNGIIRIAHDLGMEVVAEGIENQEQINYYNELHCDRLQGYFYSRPLTLDQYEALVMKSMALNSEQKR